jgi:hypothetical protein
VTATRCIRDNCPQPRNARSRFCSTHQNRLDFGRRAHRSAGLGTFAPQQPYPPGVGAGAAHRAALAVVWLTRVGDRPAADAGELLAMLGLEAG